MANEDLPRDPHLSALHRAQGERRPRVPDEVRAAVLRAAHEAVRPVAANDDPGSKDGAAAKPIGGYRAQSRFAVAAVLVLAMGMGWQLIYTTAPTPDTAVTGEETVTASMDLGAPAEAPAEAPAMAQSMDRALAREAIAPPPPVPAPPPMEAPVSAPMVANVASPVMAEAAAPAAAPPAMAYEPAPAAKSAPAAGAMADAAPQARAESALPAVVPVLVPPPVRRYKSPQAWWAEIEALRKTDAAAAARETTEFKRVYPRWPADPTPAVPTGDR
jgi:hypothetical protein